MVQRNVYEPGLRKLCLRDPRFEKILLFYEFGCSDRGFYSRSRYGCLLRLYVVLSCVGRGICDELITHPKESYHGSSKG
jgi:hypothetical protein